MIQKLRRKFILINMLLVTLVLLIVFSVLCFSSYQQSKRESQNTLRWILERDRLPDSIEPPRLELSEEGERLLLESLWMQPAFVVTVGEDGAFFLSSQTVEVSQELIEEAAQSVLASEETEGVVRSLGLRFMMLETPTETKIAFVDTAQETRAIARLLIISSLVGLGGLTAFFFISLFLSKFALAPVARAWEQQRRFVADASHELKTPLTVILANTGILLAHPNSTVKDQMKWVSNTRTEAQRMKQLVEDMLFLAKTDDGSAPMLKQKLNFSDLVWGCVLPFEAVAYEQGIALEHQITPDLFLLGDEGQLKQLVIILLDNACKYAGPNGKVDIGLERQGDRVLFFVRNTGTPIPAEKLTHIFERFYRVDGSRAREKGGYGLGLAIAKQIAENHRGRLTVTSVQEEGTTFRLMI